MLGPLFSKPKNRLGTFLVFAEWKIQFKFLEVLFLDGLDHHWRRRTPSSWRMLNMLSIILPPFCKYPLMASLTPRQLCGAVGTDVVIKDTGYRWVSDCQTYVAQDFGGWTLTEIREEMRPWQWWPWCGVWIPIFRPVTRMCRWHSRLGHQGNQKAGSEMPSLFQLSGFPHVQVLNAVGSVGPQQRWCFVDGCEFQPTNIFWLIAPLGQLNITLTCPDAGKKVAEKGEL